MKLTNERPCGDIMFDVDMSDDEMKSLIAYGKENITDEALVQFAMLDILTKKMERSKLERMANAMKHVCENAAELGCPKGKEVDMWFRELSDDGRCDVISDMETLVDWTYSK